MTARRLASLALLAALAACAPATLARRGDGPPRPVREALDAWLLRNDAGAATSGIEAALARDPSDPWAHLGAALLARRALDGQAEVRHLAAVVDAAPDHPLALVALRRLAELPERSPALAVAVGEASTRLLDGPRLAGLAAFRARVAGIAAAEARNDLDRLAALRAENGALTGWTLAGPFGAFHALELDRRFPPEEGTLPAEVAAPLLGPPRPTRTLPAPDGMVALDGEPSDGDVFYLAGEVEVTRAGRHLAVMGATTSARVWLDGAPLLERRAFEGRPPGQLVAAIDLAPGMHQVLVKLTRGAGRVGFILSLVRADGAPARYPCRPRPPGALTAVADGPWPASAWSPLDLAAALEPAGPALAGLLAARDAATSDLELAKILLDGALPRAPASAALVAARGLLVASDPSLDDQIGKGQAEAALRAALAADPGDGEARTDLAELLRNADRASDAETLLAALPDAVARRPVALAERARVASVRGFEAAAARLAEAARDGEGSCEALKLLVEQAAHREAVGPELELTRALTGCRGGRERLARLLLRRGDPDGALEQLAPLARLRPAAVEPALARAAALVASGAPARGAAELEALLALWPRDGRLLRAAADDRELAGDRGAARALRDRALAHDPTNLTLRRALALEGGQEPLADVAFDGLAVLREYQAAPRREDASSTLVLDAAAVELHAGGGMTERVHQVIRVNDQEAVNQWGEAQVPPGSQLLVLRTIKPDGRTLQPEGLEGKGSHSLAGLEPGDFVELEYLHAARGGSVRQAVAADPFYFATPGTGAFRVAYLVRGPRGLGLQADGHQLETPPVVVEGDREVVRLERTGVAPVLPEPNQPPVQELIPFLVVSVGGGREAVQRGLSDGVVERTAASTELRALAAEVRARAGAGAPPAALARAAYDLVRSKVLGAGGGLGEDASVVLSRGRGSRLVLLKAVLDLVGLKARFALIRPFGGDRSEYRFPPPGLWTSPVLRVEWPGGSAWLDPSARQEAFGALPERALDVEALILAAPGEPLEVARTPAANAQPDRRELDVRVVLAPDGSASVEGTDRYHGHLGASAKAAFEALDETRRRQAVEQFLARSLRGLALETVSFEGETDAEAPLTMRWKGRVPSLAREANGGLVVDAPLLQAQLSAQWVRLAARRTPLLVGSAERTMARLSVMPPPGYTARASTPEPLVTPFGSFARTERVEGGALVREERLVLERGRIEPEAYAAFAAFAAGVDGVQERPATFTR